MFTNSYVENLDPSIDSDKLKELFEGFGEITSAKVPPDQSGKTSIIGYVNFK